MYDFPQPDFIRYGQNAGLLSSKNMLQLSFFHTEDWKSDIYIEFIIIFFIYIILFLKRI